MIRSPFPAAVLVALAVGTAAAARDPNPEVVLLDQRVSKLEAEVAALRAELAALRKDAGTRKPAPLRITVVPGGWGAAGADDVAAVCRSAAGELYRFMPDGVPDAMTVRHDAKAGPMVVFGTGAAGERRVLLSATETFWSQYAYQFAHEFCHVAANYAEGDRSNLWFEEALCEAASLFALRRMGETWRTAPPYPNWKAYAPSLTEYAETTAADIEPLDGLSVADWYKRAEPALRAKPHDRRKNRVAAVAVLARLDAEPAHWNAVAYLNKWDKRKELSFRDYLRDWHAHVPAAHKGFVADVAKTFGMKLD